MHHDFQEALHHARFKYGSIASGTSVVLGVPYGVSGTAPIAATSSIMLYISIGLCATAKPVAVGGCACTTALTSSRFFVASHMHLNLT